jgi:aspartate carbamoyltransferase catalytic subunit
LGVHHCISADKFSKEFVDRVCLLANQMRIIAKTKAGIEYLKLTLPHKRAMLYFVQPSTRTFLSFLSACQILGMEYAEVRDPRTSSEVKGESEEDTVRTFASFFDLIIMRHHKANFAETIVNMLDRTNYPVPVVNAGSGKDQHPTQALLDIYTLKRSFNNNIDGKRIAFVGDLLRGRTVHSLLQLLAKYPGIKQYFVAPPGFQIDDNFCSYLDRAGVCYELTDDLKSVLPLVDAVYMTRLQDEWDQVDKTDNKFDLRCFSITGQDLSLLKADAVIMHPLPRRSEIAPEVDSDSRAIYWQQVRNGMWARAALIAIIFGCEDQIIKGWDYELGRGHQDNG